VANAAENKGPARGEKAEKPPRAPRQTQEGRPDKPPRAPAGEKPAREPGPERAAAEGQAPAQAAAPAAERAPRPPRPQGQGRPPSTAPKAAAGKPAMPKGPPALEMRYREQVVPSLKREFGYKNAMQVPRLKRVSINIGMGEALKSQGAIDAAVNDISLIAGQKPVVTKARKSIANFNLRQGQAIGVMVTLRGDRMWQFADRLMNVALPRVRDFRGISRDSFDGRGNYALGLKEQVVFPEIDYNKIDRLRGMQINFSTTARTDEEGRRLLELLGMPFTWPDQQRAKASTS